MKGRKLKLFSQYEAVVEYNAEEETKSYNVHRKTGDYIIGEVRSKKKGFQKCRKTKYPVISFFKVGKINVNNGETLEVGSSIH